MARGEANILNSGEVGVDLPKSECGVADPPSSGEEVCSLRVGTDTVAGEPFALLDVLDTLILSFSVGGLVLRFRFFLLGSSSIAKSATYE